MTTRRISLRCFAANDSQLVTPETPPQYWHLMQILHCLNSIDLHPQQPQTKSRAALL